MYPTLAEYTDALKVDLGLALSDPLLARGTLVRHHPGLPVTRGGTFAATFAVEVEGRKYALRCFLREIESLEARYAAIGRLLGRMDSPHFVASEFQPAGIRTWSGSYPVVRMDWAEGENLAAHVGANRNDVLALRRVQRSLRDLARHLREHEIAHGDLQPANVIVRRDGRLQLVDYDSLFVPQLAQLTSANLGHRNFRHPGRDERHFNERLDAFPFILLELALEALSREPGLWALTRSGEDAFLLRAADFADPAASRVLARMSRIPGLEAQVRDFAAICLGPFDQVPELADFLAGREPPGPPLEFNADVEGEKPPEYIPPRTVVDAAEFARCCNHVGDRVELVGRVTEVVMERVPGLDADFLRVGFGSRAHDMACLKIWPDALAALDAIPDAGWIGQWVSAVGLIEPVFTGKAGARHQKDVSISITDQSQLQRLSESEAWHRLGGLVEVSIDLAGGVATDPIETDATRRSPTAIPAPAPASPPVSMPARTPAPEPTPAPMPVRSPIPAPVPIPARASVPAPSGRAAGRGTGRRSWRRWWLPAAVIAVIAGIVLMSARAPREAEPVAGGPVLPAQPGVGAQQPAPLPLPVAAITVPRLIASNELTGAGLPVETVGGTVSIASAATDDPRQVVLYGGRPVDGLRDDSIELRHFARYTDRDVVIGQQRCADANLPCGRAQPFWLELRADSPPVLRRLGDLRAGTDPMSVATLEAGLVVDLGLWNGERRQVTMTESGNLVAARVPVSPERLDREDCATVARALNGCAESRDCSSFASSAARIPVARRDRLLQLYHESTGLDMAAFRDLCIASCRFGFTPSPWLIRTEACNGAEPGQWADVDAAAGLSQVAEPLPAGR